MIKNKKFFIFVIFTVLLSFCLTSFAIGEEINYVIKFGYSEADIPGSTGESFMANTFKNEVERLSLGKVKVITYPGSILGNNPEMVEQTQEGIIQMTGIVDAGLVAFYPAVQVLSIPYLWKTHKIAYGVLDSYFTKELIDDMIEKAGLRVITRGENGGFRCFTNSKRPIRNPDDMKGLKFRVMGSPLMLDMVKNLGASAITMPMGEVYTSLQTGVIDGQENAPFVVRVWNVYEVQKYYTLDKHTYSTLFLIINEEFFQSLPEDIKKVVLDAGEMTTKIQRRASRLAEEKILAFLSSEGLEIYDPTIEELNLFENLAKEPAIKLLEGQGLKRWIDGVVEATKEVESKLGL